MGSCREAIPPIFIDNGAQRMRADGFAKVVADHGEVHFAFFVKPIQLNDHPIVEIPVELILTLPLQAVMPGIRMALTELVKAMIITPQVAGNILLA